MIHKKYGKILPQTGDTPNLSDETPFASDGQDVRLKIQPLGITLKSAAKQKTNELASCSFVSCFTSTSD